MEIHLDNYLPEYPSFVSGIRRAPDRGYSLTPAQTETALMNALRYIPVELHEKLAHGGIIDPGTDLWLSLPSAGRPESEAYL